MVASRRNRITIPFLPNSRLVFTLPLGMKILMGWIKLYGTLTIAGGTTSGTVYGEGGPVNLIKRIKVTAVPLSGSRYPGGDIVDATPRALLRFATIYRNGKFFGDQAGVTLNNGATGTYPVQTFIPIYWHDRRKRQSAIAALNTDGPGSTTVGGTYASLQVEVVTGDLTSCFTGNDRTPTSSFNLNCDWIDNRAAIDGDTVVRYQEDHTFLVPAPLERALDQSMPNDGAFESWTVLEEQGAQATLASTILQRLQVSSPDGDYDKYKTDILEDMLDGAYIDPSTNAAGMNHFDWTYGIAQNRLMANTLQTWFQVLNPSGANLDALRIFTRRLVAPLPGNS